MHRVERNTPPSSLVLKDADWKQLLLKKPDSDHEWGRFCKRKLKKETLKQLEFMYQECCCYCEAKISSSSYPEIEHFRPKSKREYKHLCYDYINLHYCCKKCNLHKADEYNEKMVSPSDDEPETHLYYDKYVAKALDERGQEMINIIGLNTRKELESIRIDYFDQFENLYSTSVECIMEIKKRNLTKQEVNFIEIFMDRVFKESKHGHPFCSMIMKNFYEKAKFIKKILIQMGYLEQGEQDE
jgi:uncharacterized protein (TIGR02646 family)